MAEVHLLTIDAVPPALHGLYGDYSIRPTTSAERLAIEDDFFERGLKISVPRGTTSIVVPKVQGIKDTADYLECIEFALALLCDDGFATVSYSSSSADAKFSSSAEYRQLTGEPQFADALQGNDVSHWMAACMQATARELKHARIIHNRYLRYIRASDAGDALLDLSICLEALVGSQTEIAFKFSMLLTKCLGYKDDLALETQRLLKRLYTVRCKIAHGDPDAEKEFNKISPDLPGIRKLSRKILVTYVTFIAEKTRSQWATHLEEVAIR
ncbi:MAG: hypothetical protein ACR2IE_17385 [Candidatus Sumerlaeaceae bacterium]